MPKKNINLKQGSIYSFIIIIIFSILSILFVLLNSSISDLNITIEDSKNSNLYYLSKVGMDIALENINNTVNINKKDIDKNILQTVLNNQIQNMSHIYLKNIYETNIHNFVKNYINNMGNDNSIIQFDENYKVILSINSSSKSFFINSKAINLDNDVEVNISAEATLTSEILEFDISPEIEKLDIKIKSKVYYELKNIKNN